MNTELRIRDFKRVVFFTGAGMSAASGIPTYRGKGGMWKEYDWQECACQKAFDLDPEKVWDFHNVRRLAVAACKPNAGHDLVARCEAVLPSVTVVTQNIDGLHQVAGSKRVHELHGSLWRVRCDDCGAVKDTRDVPFDDLRCGQGWWRPDIVWFGDALKEEVINSAAEAIGTCDLLVSIGTSAVVFPAAELPKLAAKFGATLIEINPEATALSHIYDVHMRSGASEALEILCEGLE